MYFLKSLRISAIIALMVFAGCKKEVVEMNSVPVADAGNSQSVTLPVGSITLAGSGSDSDGDVVAFLWSQVAGPSDATIVTPGSATTTVKSVVEGDYVFQLMVVDDAGATGVDTTKVTVNKAPQTTLTLQPANNPLELQVSLWNGNNQTYSGAVDIPLQAWTINAKPMTVREVLKFDLSTIPQNATIKSAHLFLYSFPAPTINGNLTDANFGLNNGFIVQQIISNWDPNTVGWFNQPMTATNNQIIIPSTTQPMLDMDLDVKEQVSSMVSSNSNYGFLLKLQNEVTYTSRLFVSSYNTTYPAKRPKLVIVYE